MPTTDSGPNADKDRDERLKALRERLYSRGWEQPKEERHQLHDIKRDVPQAWPSSAQVEEPAPPPQTPEPTLEELIMPRHKKRAYRTTLILIGLVFFVSALILSATFLFFGKNTISGENITVEFSQDVPLAIGGGEELPFDIYIANQNAVPIESATLIVEYPIGTQSAEQPGVELFRERKQINSIASGEVLKIPIRAVVFGEENEEKTVTAAVEYRVQGSNATFFKEATPYRFKISSSPVILSVDGLVEAASGQEATVKLSVSSNAPSALTDILVKAEYPQGFDFNSSEPSPASGRDTWLISELKPEEVQTIELRGILVGEQDETKVFRFSVGVANERDRFGLASIFTSQTHEINVEQPFLDVAVRIGGDANPEVTIAPGADADVSVTIKNTLSDTLYDAAIAVRLSGNALDDSGVRSTDGFYDSTTNTITFDAGSTAALRDIQPGESVEVDFTVSPKEGGDASRTPQVTLSVNVKGRRVSEDRVPQELGGAIERTIKIASGVELGSQVLYSIGPFKNTGPVPPKAEEVTTYTVTLGIANGSNAVTDAKVETTLPTYVAWLDLTTFGSSFSYNAVTRSVAWDVGDLDPSEVREASFQISILPSVSQVGQTPTLVGEQRFSATDRFTGTIIRATSRALTTRLTADPDDDTKDGQVEPKD